MTYTMDSYSAEFPVLYRQFEFFPDEIDDDTKQTLNRIFRSINKSPIVGDPVQTDDFSTQILLSDFLYGNNSKFMFFTEPFNAFELFQIFNFLVSTGEPTSVPLACNEASNGRMLNVNKSLHRMMVRDVYLRTLSNF
jgi:hypothetical protein